jgi:DNA-binding MarR family transcriptional regulator
MPGPRLISRIHATYYRGMATPLPECDYSFAARRAARHISQIYERHLALAHVTPNQFNILCALNRTECMTMAELTQSMLLDRTTLVRTLQPLLREHLIESAQRAGTGRSLEFRITASGGQRLQDASEHWLAAQREFEMEFGEAAAGSLRTDLIRIAHDVPNV